MPSAINFAPRSETTSNRHARLTILVFIVRQTAHADSGVPTDLAATPVTPGQAHCGQNTAIIRYQNKQGLRVDKAADRDISHAK